MSLVLLFRGGGSLPSGSIPIPAGALVFKGPATPVPPVTSPTIAIPVRALSLQGQLEVVSQSGLRQPGAGALSLAGYSPALSVSGAAAIVIPIDPGAIEWTGHPASVIAGPPALPPLESWVVIQGIDRTAMLRAAQLLEIEYTLGARGVGRCEILDRDRYHDTASAYRPLVDHTISLTYHGQTLFNGNILAVDDHALIDPRLGVVTAIGAADYARVTGQRVMSFVYPAGNLLKGIVTHINDTWLSVYNITLDPGMADGPTLGEQIFDLVSVETALNHLAAITGWVWRITPAKVLEMFAPGTKTAPFALSPLNANIRGGVTWSKARTKYVNRCYVRYGTETQVEKTDWFLSPGGQSTFVLTYGALIADRGYVIVNGVIVPIGAGTNWVTSRTALIANPPYEPAAGDIIEITYTAQFPLVLEYSDPAEVTSYGPFEEVVDMPDTFDIFAANEMAMSVVRSYKTTPRTLTIRTRAGFVLPGTTISISVPARLVSGEWMVTAVRIREEVDQELLYEYTCLEGLEHHSTWLDFWRQVVGQPATTKTVSGSVSGAAIPAASGSFAGPISAQGPQNAWTANFLGSQTAPSYGVRIQAGTSASDVAFSVLNANETVSLFAVRGTGIATMGTQVVTNADPGDLVLKNGADLRSVDSTGVTTAISLVSLNTSNQVVLAGEGHDIRWGRPAIATGGATGAVLGTLGSGPTTPTQAGWLRVVSSTGAVVYLPFWT